MAAPRRIIGLSSMATRQILAELAKSFDRLTGCEVDITSIGGVDAARMVRAGEVLDVVVLASNVMAQLEAEGRIVAGTRTDIVSSGIAVALRAGAPRPDIATEDDVRQAVMDARRICYSTGPSGQHLTQLFERWGIAELVAVRLVQASPGVSVASLVAQGEADLGFQQLSEMLHVPGIEIIAELPPPVQSTTVFTAGIGAVSANPDDALAFVAYLASPETHVMKRDNGMEPVEPPEQDT